MKIFIDSSAFIALANRKDSHHQKARKLSEKFLNRRNKFFVTNLILFESATMISMRVGKSQALKFIDNFPEHIKIIKLTDQLEETAWQTFHKIKDKKISVVDCLSFVVIEKYNFNKAFTFDTDFPKFGIEILE